MGMMVGVGGAEKAWRAMACCRAASITFCISVREDSSRVTRIPFKLDPVFCIAKRASSSVLGKTLQIKLAMQIRRSL